MLTCSDDHCGGNPKGPAPSVVPAEPPLTSVSYSGEVH